MPPSLINRHHTVASQLELATAAHDLRNRLNVAGHEFRQVRSELSAACDADLVESLASAELALAQTNAQLEALLQLAQSQLRVPTSSTAHPTDIVSLARQVIAQQQPDADVVDVVELRNAVPQLIGPWDRSRLRTVLHHLLANARQYSQAAAPVLVCIDRHGADAVVSVVDHGIGIPEGDLPHVCQAFFRARNVPEHSAGLGLGLATARFIVEQYAGSLTIESVVGSGTTVTVHLPVAAF